MKCDQCTRRSAIHGYRSCYLHLRPGEAGDLTGTVYRIVGANGRTHYVGATITPLSQRLQDHVARARTYGRLYGDGTRKPHFPQLHQFTRWMWTRYVSKGRRPRILPIVTVPFDLLADFETAAIAGYRAVGEPLKNKSDTRRYR